MHQSSVLASLSVLLATSGAQQVGTYNTETHPQLTTQKCTTSGGCTDQSTSIVLDANWRWLHEVGSYTNCYTGNEWDTSICTDVDTCTSDCAVEGADYSGTYGITTSGNALTLKFVTEGSSTTNIGSRVYLLTADSDDTYELFKLKNQEFTFDVDVSNLPCGLNGALYFSEMEADGGLSSYSTNKAGAKYGTGYCDTQCPHDLKFISGEANILDWEPSDNDSNAGTGRYGSCCNEMDIWEANSQAAAYTPHVCASNITGPYRCSGTACGDDEERYEGVCDKDGCDFNSYRMGNTTFYGEDLIVDTTAKFTVITQFITADGTADGDLTEIRRKYVQDGVVIENSYADYETLAKYNSITDDYCTAQKTLFNDTNDFETKGGLATMGDAFSRGMVLVMSLWDDHAANALWLDSQYPVGSNASAPGVTRGPCGTDTGVPSEVESEYPDASVVYSNIRYGDIDSTY